MATDILLTDLTDGNVVSGEWTGTGIFDTLISAVNSNIQLQYEKGRLKGPDYANVYLGSIQSVIAQSMQYLLQEKVTEAQVDGILADNLLKAKQLEIAEEELLLKQKELDIRIAEENRLKDTTEAELEKQWGYAVTRDIDDNLVLGTSTGEGQIDKQTLDVIASTTLKTSQNAEVLAGTVRADAESTAKIALIDEQTESEAIKNDPIDGVLIKERQLMDEQILETQEKVDLLQSQDAELLANGVKDRDIKERQMVVAEAQSAKDLLIKDEQIIEIQEKVDLLQTQDLAAIYEKDNILPEQLSKLQEETGIAYVTKVKADKETAMLGLDDVMKLSTEAKDGTTVYVTKYNKA